MKKQIILFAFLTIGSLTLLAQAPPPPPDSGNNYGLNSFVGDTSRSAPVGNGTFMLIAFASAYAGHKVYAVQADKSKE